MSPRELSNALLNLDNPYPPMPPDPHQLTRAILASDRRRIRLLASLAIMFWLLAVAGLLLLVLSLHWFIRSVRIQEVERDMERWRAQHIDPTDLKRPPAAGRLQRFLDTDLFHHSIPLIAGSLGAMFLAALCTVLLVLSSRRATLHQINASLIEICEQIKQMRPAARGGGPAE